MTASTTILQRDEKNYSRPNDDAVLINKVVLPASNNSDQLSVTKNSSTFSNIQSQKRLRNTSLLENIVRS
jgi:hypothetical protein